MIVHSALVPRCQVALILALTGLFRGAAAEPYRPTDYQVKAAFLYNFAKFVRWPDEGLPGPRFVVAVVGEDPFGETLDRAFAGKTILDRPVEVRRTRDVRDAGGAQIVFVGASEEPRLASTLAVLRRGRALTVGDMDRFADGGGMIGFRIKEATVRFEVNLREVRQAGLQMSSQLVKLALRVIPDGA
jgi:hypothetical protein